MSGSTRPLSSIARALVLPEGIVTTGWPAVEQVCRELGLGFDPWQASLGRAILGKRKDGRYAASIGGVVLSIPRQVGKTYLMGAIVFALCLIFPGLTVIWTAHRVKTAGETFKAMQALARMEKVSPFIERVLRGAGTEAIAFKNGSRILFGARERGFGRGFAGVGVIVLDEAQILTENTLDDMVPAMNTAANPLLLMVGTPPKPTDPGEVFATRREEALSGHSSDLLYCEIAADPDCDPREWPADYVDWQQVAKANPSFPARTPRASVLRMLRQLGRESFRREGLGLWDEVSHAGGVITPDRWADCLDPASRVEIGQPVIAVDAAPGLERATIVAAGLREDGATHVEVTSLNGVVDCRDGASWIVDRLANKRLSVVMVDGSAVAALKTQLEEAGVFVELVDRAEYEKACVGFVAAVRERRVFHRGQADLDKAVVAGAKRGFDEGLFTWGRRKSRDDISPLVAATVAAWRVQAYDVSATIY